MSRCIRLLTKAIAAPEKEAPTEGETACFTSAADALGLFLTPGPLRSTDKGEEKREFWQATSWLPFPRGKLTSCWLSKLFSSWSRMHKLPRVTDREAAASAPAEAPRCKSDQPGDWRHHRANPPLHSQSHGEGGGWHGHTGRLQRVLTQPASCSSIVLVHETFVHCDSV